MYLKLINIEQISLQTITKLIADKLPEYDISLITQIYQQRLLTEPEFNSKHFFLDLKGYLKYLTKEEKYNSYSISSIRRTFSAPVGIVTRENLLKRHGYFPAVAYGEDGHAKMSYLAVKKNEIVRFYYARPSMFFYSKLLGVSETDINKAVNNQLLTVASVNIPGEPMDVMERALPLSEVFDYLEENSCSEIVSEIEEVKKSNPLITDFIEGSDDNIGLVVRLDQQGNKKVYVVAFDLDLRNARHVTEGSDQQLLELIRQQQFANLKPKSLDYDYLVEFIPDLQDLATQFSSSVRNQ